MIANAAVCLLYPTSRDVADLTEPFRTGVTLFLTDLRRNGCTVEITATRRPEQRAWLMRGAWDVFFFGLDHAPDPRGDIPITWTKEGAKAMVREYRLAYRPSLTSHHISGNAIDMTITGWKGTKPELYALGATYGVHKLVSDPPHWSVDGG